MAQTVSTLRSSDAGADQQYILPADPPEFQRLDLQQRLLTYVRDGLFLFKQGVYQALAPRPDGSRPVVLDLGCGSGYWTIEMAKQFPDADVIGVDLVVPTVKGPIPPNCRFEQHDLNNGINHPQQSVDLIHASCIAQGITDFRACIDKIHETLRPGGVFLSVSGDMQMCGEDKQPWIIGKEGDPSFSYHVNWMNKLWDAMKAKGPGILAYPSIASWLDEMEWEATGFHEAFIPIGPWRERMTDRDREASELMRQNMLGLQQSTRQSLELSGVPKETVNAWFCGAQDELIGLRKHIHCHWLFSWAVKRQDVSRDAAVHHD